MTRLELDAVSMLLREALEAGEQTRASALLAALHPADIGHVLELLQEEQRASAFALLSVKTAADVLAEMDEEPRQALLERLSSPALARVVSHMDSDEATDVVTDLPQQEAQAVLAELPAQEAQEIRELATHEEDTAGGIMAKEFATVPSTVTAQEALILLRRNFTDLEEMYVVHVTAPEGTLLGSVSLRDLVLAEPDTPLRELAERHQHWVEAHADREEVVRRMTHYGLIALPVVDARALRARTGAGRTGPLYGTPRHRQGTAHCSDQGPRHWRCPGRSGVSVEAQPAPFPGGVRGHGAQHACRGNRWRHGSFGPAQTKDRPRFGLERHRHRGNRLRGLFLLPWSGYALAVALRQRR